MGGLNIKRAATLCGINPESWRRYEAGGNVHDLPDVCRRISKATGYDYRWLIAGGELTSVRKVYGGAPLALVSSRDQPDQRYRTKSDRPLLVPVPD